MNLPGSPPVDPMLARLARSLPSGDLPDEPTWDGFRCLVFRDGDDLLLQSRNGRGLDRYFPELVDPDGPDPLRAQLPPQVVLDGELVVPVDGRLDFDALANRVHPARSRVDRLAAETPARHVAFDLLALGDEDLTAVAFCDRRQRLEESLSDVHAPLHVTPATTLVPVGVASSFSRERRAELVDELAPMRLDDPSSHPWNTDAAPRGVSRWTGGRDTSWEPLDCRRVAEGAYEQLTGNRFRHSARWRRWRDDRDPQSCRFDQLDVPVASEIDRVFAEG